MLGLMILTFIQEKPALLLFSSNTLLHIHCKPSEWICHRCSPVKTSLSVSPKNILNGASCQLGSLSVSNITVYLPHCSNFVPCPVCMCMCLSLCIDVCTHPNTYPCQCVSLCLNGPSHASTKCASLWCVCMSLCVTQWSLKCFWAFWECAQQWRGEWQLTSPLSPESGADQRQKNKRDKEPSP